MDISPEVVNRLRFLRALDEPERQQLLRAGRLRSLGRGEAVWEQGQQADDFAFVVRGQAKLVKVLNDEYRCMIRVAASGSLACGMAPCALGTYCCKSLALEDDVEVLDLPRREVLELATRNPGAARAFFSEVAACGVEVCQRIEEMGVGQVERRAALLLSRLARRTGAQRPDGSIRVNAPLTRRDIAELCGTTVESAIRTMSKLERRGLVQKAARGFLVTDVDALEALAHDVGRRR